MVAVSVFISVITLAEFMIVKCRPFLLLWDFTAIIPVAVYSLLSSSNSYRNEALSEPYHAISEQQTGAC